MKKLVYQIFILKLMNSLHGQGVAETIASLIFATYARRKKFKFFGRDR